MAQSDSCRNAAIQSLSGEQQTFLAHVRSVTFDSLQTLDTVAIGGVYFSSSTVVQRRSCLRKASLPPQAAC